MNSVEARRVLNACPPGRWPKNDSLVRDARAVAQEDRELGTWLRKSRVFDAAIANWLRMVAVPEDLKAAILAGHRSGPGNGRDSVENLIRSEPPKSVAING